MVTSSNDLYNRNFGGKLKLKGLKGKGLRQKRTSTEDTASHRKDTGSAAVREVEGSGRIVSSGNTIQGFGTKFTEEVAIGDTITVKHPLSNANEERKVDIILSNRALCLNDAFSSDLITTSVYVIRKKEPEGDSAQDEGLPKVETKKTSTITLREKTGMWSYKTTTKVVKAEMSAEDRLNERVKHSRDKYCW
ncbi:uncharacterized protein BXIN_2260 [Babesia sp. Xinjiang]|uniref:uncharacterized protein n=1 Tax=Babesia sp. Xinjiang TaxID=462227 RepID=UPI000A2223FF|nr:uncharacterized protein BXIN_2260 [Babesia sp. Xinjiang]ORM40813.1 hypothetical protein BXIN_2260 [Babesia sp. Xinjiang]